MSFTVSGLDKDGEPMDIYIGMDSDSLLELIHYLLDDDLVRMVLIENTKEGEEDE